MEPQPTRRTGRKRSKATDSTAPRERVVTRTEAPLDHEDVARRAYALYQQRGGADGHAWDDWLSAERELSEERARRRTQ